MTCPDILLARIEEQVSITDLRLVRAQLRLDLTAYTRYSQGRSVIDTYQSVTFRSATAVYPRYLLLPTA